MLHMHRNPPRGLASKDEGAHLQTLSESRLSSERPDLKEGEYDVEVVVQPGLEVAVVGPPREHDNCHDVPQKVHKEANVDSGLGPPHEGKENEGKAGHGHLEEEEQEEGQTVVVLQEDSELKDHSENDDER